MLSRLAASLSVLAGGLVIDEIDDAICATARRERLDRGERRSLSYAAVRCL
jgi:hypothetical protein